MKEYLDDYAELYNRYISTGNMRKDVLDSLKHTLGYWDIWNRSLCYSPIFKDVEDLFIQYKRLNDIPELFFGVLYNIDKFNETYDSKDILKFDDYITTKNIRYRNNEIKLTYILINMIENDTGFDDSEIESVYIILNRLIIDCSSVKAYLYKLVMDSKYTK